MTKQNYLNSIEAANLLGVNVSTIKRWTDSGKLNCIQTTGGHRKFLMKHINEYLKNQPETGKNITVIPYDSSDHRQLNHLIQKHKINELYVHLLNNALKSNRENVNMIITGLALAQYPVYKMFDKLITPVLHKIGDMWEQKTLSVAEEHMASDIIRDSILQIREIIIRSESNSLKAFCFALDDDRHDIALKMIQVILEQRGFDVFYSGQSTPADSIEKLISNYRPDRIYLSCTYYDEKWNKERLEAKNYELMIIFKLAKKYKFDVYLGGEAFNHLNFNSEVVKRRLYTFKEVDKY